jgi:hypothetical protein
VVGDGYERGELELIFDLAAFEIIRKVRWERWRPITGCVIEFITVRVAAVTFPVGEDGSENFVLGPHVCEKIEGFFRHAGVTMQGNARSETSFCVLGSPCIGNA